MDFIKKIKKGDYYENVNNLSIEELEEIIDYTSDLYHKEGKSVITDAEYDILIDFLKLKSPKSKLLKKIGANIKKDKDKVKLDYHLGSMDKIKIGDKKLESWIKKYNPPYNISDKLDGVSGLLIYENNKISLYTRGSSTEGFDISHLIKYLNLPSYEDVSKYFKVSKIAFRGELIMKDSIFTHNWSDKMKNARNTIAGLVNSKTINPELANDTDFVVYEVIDPFYPIDKQLKIISDLKFKIAPNKNINVELTFEYLSNYLKDRKSKSDYIIDGIIITAISNKKRNTKDNPDYAFAL
jgi:NAD-dependent DNA ligase